MNTFNARYLAKAEIIAKSRQAAIDKYKSSKGDELFSRRLGMYKLCFSSHVL